MCSCYGCSKEAGVVVSELASRWMREHKKPTSERDLKVRALVRSLKTACRTTKGEADTLAPTRGAWDRATRDSKRYSRSRATLGPPMQVATFARERMERDAPIYAPKDAACAAPPRRALRTRDLN